MFHGLAVNLDSNDDRAPFHGAFLIHEMRVQGRWPLLSDRQIPLPIRWQSWIPKPDVSKSGGGSEGGDGGEGEGADHEDDRMGEQSDLTSDLSSMYSSTPIPEGPSDHPPSHRAR